MAADCVLVLTTLETEEDAVALAREILQSRLAACIQLRRVRSLFPWEGEIRDGYEWLLVAKTPRRAFANLAEFIRIRHGYALPEIIQVPISDGSADYLRWLDGAVYDDKPPGASSNH
ncbi:MAG: divalent-cation tolerance protein CutA [Puniceicoccales bacterium]|jgi:periplasmic divalent cation tolerance protein|nr:divalent-cation tolerance protein CutA [Puniceicoccales bacterium]